MVSFNQKCDNRSTNNKEWTLDQRKLLLKLMKKRANTMDGISFKKRLKEFDWEAIKAHFPEYNAEECALEFEQIIKKVPRFRTFLEVFKLAIWENNLYQKYKEIKPMVTKRVAEKTKAPEEKMLQLNDDKLKNIIEAVKYNSHLYEKYLNSPVRLERILNKFSEEDCFLYLRHIGFPERDSLDIFFHHISKPKQLEDLSVSVNLDLFARCSSKQKLQFVARAMQWQDAYNVKYENWYNQQTSLVKAMVHKVHLDIDEPRTTLELLLVKMSLPCVRVSMDVKSTEFDPPEPIFERYYGKDEFIAHHLSKDIPMEEIEAKLKTTTAKELRYFASKANNRKRAHKRKILRYCQELSLKQIKIFLGLRRLQYIQIYGDDIFRVKYPVEAHPIYVFGHWHPMKTSEKSDLEESLRRLEQGL